MRLSKTGRRDCPPWMWTRQWRLQPPFGNGKKRDCARRSGMIASEAPETGCPCLSRRAFVKHTAILNGQLVDQASLAGHCVAVGVPEFEIAVAEFEDRDIGV